MRDNDMKAKSFFRSALRFVLCFAVLASICLSAVGCGNATDEYIAATGWNMDNETFMEEYVPEFNSFIGRLHGKKVPTSQRTVDYFSDNAKFYLYNEEFTLMIYVGNFETFGECIVQLLYYGSEEGDLLDFEKQRSYVELAATILHEFCYDTEKEVNPLFFEKLFDDCLKIKEEEESKKDEEDKDSEDGEEEEKETPNASHHVFDDDNMLDNLGYEVMLEYESDPYFYMMKGEAAVIEDTIPANSFMFYGLLKGAK